MRKDFWAFLLSVKRRWGRLLTGSLLIGLVWFSDRISSRRVPTWVFWLLLVATLFWAFFGAWREEHRKAVLFDYLPLRHQHVVMEWEKLANLYQNSAKGENDPKTLIMPMESRQPNDCEFLFRIGVLQAKTQAVLTDLKLVGKDVGYDNEDIRSVPELLEILRRAKF